MSEHNCRLTLKSATAIAHAYGYGKMELASKQSFTTTPDKGPYPYELAAAYFRLNQWYWTGF